MRNARNLFYSNRFFLAGYLLFFFFSFFFWLATSKAQSFLFLNSYHPDWLNSFFIVYTNLGDGLFSIGLVILLLFLRRFTLAWEILAAYAISGLLAQLIKHLFDSPRPMEYFKLKEHIFYVEGITNTGNGSFPSGHSASIFALAAILSFFSKNKKYSGLYLLIAILVGYSRIYLSQHFLFDVLIGSLVGIVSAIGVHLAFSSRGVGRKKKLAER
jgi:membrane-associated phospholipid phosphatase